MPDAPSLMERIDRALVESMKARKAPRTSALRLVRAALKNREIDKRGPLDDQDVLQVLATLAKQRKESIEQFRSAGREDLALKEEAELAVLEEFMPRQLTEGELETLIRRAIEETGVQGPKDLGKLMAALMPQVRGRADGKKVNELARGMLTGGDRP